MPITLRDIAERTGVSPSVVSTVLSGRENGTFVSKDTRQRVLDVAQQLNYTPVRSGRPRGSRRLRRMRTEQFIGIWAPATDRPALTAISALHHAINEVSHAEPGSDDDLILGLRLVSDAELPRLDTLGLMGIIIVGDIALPRIAATANIPTIQLGEADHATRDVTSIHLDNFPAGQAVGEYLWKLGHRTLAFVAPASKPRVTRHRWQGLQSVWVEQGAPHTACVPAPYDSDRTASFKDQIEQTMRKLYVSAPQKPATAPTSVVCFDETVAAYVLQSLHRLGKRVPEDVSVATFGDSDGGAEAMLPAMTTVKIPLEYLAKTAIKELVARAEAAEGDSAMIAEPKQDVKILGSLVVRDSCAPPAVAVSA